MELLKEFINESTTFSGFVFQGCYNMKPSHFLDLLEYYERTGENLLDSYSKLTYLIWDVQDEGKTCSHIPILDHDSYNLVIELLSNEKLCSYFDDDELGNILSYSEKLYKNYLKHQSYSSRRIKACIYTSNPTIRKKVFKLHGKICLHCGSSENIQLDHVVSIKNGGQDEIDNLQPLCKSCNIYKGSKNKDFRVVSDLF